jgi:hypothetical protein
MATPLELLNRKRKQPSSSSSVILPKRETIYRVQHDFIKFVQEYTMKFYKPMDVIFRSNIHKWFKTLPQIKSKENITEFSGGKYTVEDFDEYIKVYAETVSQNQVMTINEMLHATLETYTPLVFELDYRNTTFMDEKEIERHIYTIHNKVLSYIAPELLRTQKILLFVYKCEAKPKQARDHWKIAQGIHLHYAFRVSLEFAARIVFGVVLELRLKGIDSSIIDNRYAVSLNKKQTTIMLRPPYSCKVDDRCMICCTPTAQPETSAEYECTICKGTKQCIDTNTYRLHTILQNDSSVAIDELTFYSKSIQQQMKMCSLLTTYTTIITNISIPQSEMDLPLISIMRKNEPVDRSVDNRKFSISALCRNTESKLAKQTTCKELKVDTDILPSELLNVIKRTHVNYQNIEIDSVKGSYNKEKGQYTLTLLPKGSYASFCLHLKDYHRSNRCRFMFVYQQSGIERSKNSRKKYTNISNIKFYAGCFDDDCFKSRGNKRLTIVKTIQSTTSDPAFKIIEQFIKDSCKETTEKK